MDVAMDFLHTCQDPVRFKKLVIRGARHLQPMLLTIRKFFLCLRHPFYLECRGYVNLINRLTPFLSEFAKSRV